MEIMEIPTRKVKTYTIVPINPCIIFLYETYKVWFLQGE